MQATKKHTTEKFTDLTDMEVRILISLVDMKEFDNQGDDERDHVFECKLPNDLDLYVEFKGIKRVTSPGEFVNDAGRLKYEPGAGYYDKEFGIITIQNADGDDILTSEQEQIVAKMMEDKISIN